MVLATALETNSHVHTSAGKNISMQSQLFLLTREKNVLTKKLSAAHRKSLSLATQLSSLTSETSALTTMLSTTNGQNVSMESQLYSLKCENKALMKKLSDANTHLQELPMLQEKLAMVEEQLDNERWKCSKTKRQLTADHSKELAKLKRELEDTKRSLSLYQVNEVEALQKQTLAENQLEKEREEWREDMELMICEHATVIDGLQQELQDTKERLRQYDLLEQEAQVLTEEQSIGWTGSHKQLWTDIDSFIESFRVNQLESEKGLVSYALYFGYLNVAISTKLDKGSHC